MLNFTQRKGWEKKVGRVTSMGRNGIQRSEKVARRADRKQKRQHRVVADAPPPAAALRQGRVFVADGNAFFNRPGPRLVESAEIIAETEVLKADIATLSAAVARQPSGAEQMQTVAGLMEKGRGETVAAVTGPLLQRVNALATHFETRQDESAASLSQVAERLAAAERAITLSVQRAEESHKTYAQELADVHEALMKLNSNQHTLAGTIDQWRTHGSSELGLISKRMDGVEREVAKPVEMIEQMSVSLEAMHRITVARHHRRNRFWYWLFGTDDWLAASWPSQSARIAEELRAIKQR